MSQKVLLTSKEVNIILHRLACQLIEKHLDFSSSVLIGIQPRGVYLAQRLKNILEKINQLDLFETLIEGKVPVSLTIQEMINYCVYHCNVHNMDRKQ